MPASSLACPFAGPQWRVRTPVARPWRSAPRARLRSPAGATRAPEPHARGNRDLVFGRRNKKIRKRPPARRSGAPCSPSSPSGRKPCARSWAWRRPGPSTRTARRTSIAAMPSVIPPSSPPSSRRKVCLQRGYGNCPRYLRGVLVIPTEELEALRRPLPPGARPAPAHRSLSSRKRRGRARPSSPVLGVLVLLRIRRGRRLLVPPQPGGIVGGGSDAARRHGHQRRADQPLRAGRRRPDADARPPSSARPQAVPEHDAHLRLRPVRQHARRRGCGSDQNHDGREDTPLDCEIAAATALNAQAIDNGTVGEVGLVGFATGAVTADLADERGTQSSSARPSTTTPMAPRMSSRRWHRPSAEPSAPRLAFRVHTGRHHRNDHDGLQRRHLAACDLTGADRRIRIASSSSCPTAHRTRGGEHVSTSCPARRAAVFQTFAAGVRRPICEQSRPRSGWPEVMADLTEGSCTTVTDLSQLPEILEAVVVPQIIRIQLTIDDGEPIDISQAATPSLPEPGPRRSRSTTRSRRCPRATIASA